MSVNFSRLSSFTVLEESDDESVYVAARATKTDLVPDGSFTENNLVYRRPRDSMDVTMKDV